MKTKVCSRCKIEKEVGEFNKDSQSKDRLHKRCRECEVKYRKILSSKNKEKRNKDNTTLMFKKCSNCAKTKHTLEFGKDTTRVDGLRGVCKQCRKTCYLDHKDECKIKRSLYYKQNKEAIQKRAKLCRQNNIMRYKEYSRKSYCKNKQIRLERGRSYHKKNKEALKIKKRIYINNNRAAVRERSRKYAKHKKETDISYRLSTILRRRLNHAIKNNFKSGSAVRDLGCSVEFLKEYLEGKFTEIMSWDNYGRKGWHIDHIIPLSAFDLTNRDEFLIACNYKNLQPLWAKDNLSKGTKLDWVK